MSRRASLSWAAAAIVFCGLLAGIDARPAAAQDPLAPLDEIQEARDPLAPASLPEEPGSPSVEQVTRWVASTGDNGGRPFIVIDKIGAEVFLYDSVGQFMGKAPALLGSAAGDDSTPGVGDRELNQIKPEERTTPAGRFVASFGIARGNERVLWVDYPTAISLHPVVTGSRKEQRLKRLKSPTADDNRITYGCINVPAAFYAQAVRPLFENKGGVVYILPDTKPLNEVFTSLPG